MTEQPGESLDPKPAADEASAANSSESVPGGSSPQVSAHPEGTPVAVAQDEGLPEWEPLTPELVEDEAIRGDFVIRWVVVGLALLLGISQIGETRTLLHLKSGQYLLSHGLLPGANDMFSYTANDRKWVNLAWLFDVAMAGIHSLGGGIGLSIIQGLMAGVAFGLLAHTVRPHIRTWWGSICAVLALLVCYPQFTVQPELVTLLGISFVLWTLVQSEEPGRSPRLWRLVPILWLWAQCDQRAWLGWFLLLLWAVGERLTRDASSDREKGLLAKVLLISLAAVAVHPFLWESWLAPVRMYLTDYPAMRFAYPQPSILDQGFYPIVWLKDKDYVWVTVNHRTIAALFLAAITVVTLILNRMRLRWSHVLAFIGFNTLSVLATHELAVASLVNCVLCTLNAQGWYREKFGQVYSIDWRELLFSRGGRAVTVISFFALAWLILSGRLDGPTGKRTGIGFEAPLASMMNDYQNLGQSLVDDHPFHFSIRQGDLLVWGGQKSFVDSRVGLYFGSGDANLLSLHDKARRALRDRIEDRSEAGSWRTTFEKYRIRQACPRLNGPVPPPDYITFLGLLGSSEFQLVNLNGSTAVFVRPDPSDDTTTTYLRDHSFDVVDLAFRKKPTEIVDETREFSKVATTYDNLFSLRRLDVPSGIQAGQHFLQLAISSGESHSKAIAAALLAIRHVNEGLRIDPNCPDGYRVLGWAYSFLSRIESAVLSQGGPVAPNKLRYYQSIAAFQQAVALQPDNPAIVRLLLQQYEMTGRMDIRLDLIRKLKELQSNSSSKATTDEQRQEGEQISQAIVQLEETVGRIEAMVANFLGNGTDRLQVANGANQAGGLLISIKVLEDDAIYLAKNPVAKLTLGSWLMEAGRGRDAAEIFESLEGIAQDNSFVKWRDPAAMSAMTVANYNRAIKLWSDQTRVAVETNLPTEMFTLPFVTLNPQWIGPDTYPATNVAATLQTIQSVRIEGAQLHYNVALAQLEAGAVEEAAQSVREAIQANPTSPLRPILRFYLECLTGEQIELKLELPEVEEVEDLTELADSSAVKSENPPAADADKKPEVDSNAKPE